jgi:hypothetical protein
MITTSKSFDLHYANMPYRIHFDVRGLRRRMEIHDWCEQHIGSRYQTWAVIPAWDGGYRVWSFVHESDAVMFSLTWC